MKLSQILKNVKVKNEYTDREVTDEQELLDRYKNQIGFYKDAVSKALKKPVKEAVIYSFYLNKLCVYK